MALNLKNAPIPLAKAALKALAEQYPQKVGDKVSPPKRSKYGNKRTLCDGIWFDSQGEAERYQKLKLMERAGLIANLQTQVKYDLCVGDTRIGYYVADFVYWTRQDNFRHKVVEDFKGLRTPLYKWKAKHLLAQYGIKVYETSKLTKD
jgi:hypothetical protein